MILEHCHCRGKSPDGAATFSGQLDIALMRLNAYTKQMRTTRLVTSVVFFIVLPAILSATVHHDDARFKIEGSIDRAVQGDSLYYFFDIQTSGFRADTIWLTWDKEPILFARDSTGVVILPGATIDSSTNRYRVTGVAKIELMGDIPKTVSARAHGVIGEDSVRVDGWKGLTPYTRRLLFNMYGFGYGEGDLSPTDIRHSGLFACDFGVTVLLPESEISAVYSYSGSGGEAYRYSFAEPFAIRGKWLPFKRTGMVPSIMAGVKRSVFKFRRQQNEFKDTGWGVEAGVALEGAFERFGYKYSAALGGYHTFSVMLASKSSDFLRIGTRFEYVRLDRGDVFRVLFHSEGIGWVDCETESLNRINDRPLYHKILSRVILAPLVPIIGIAKLFGANSE